MAENQSNSNNEEFFNSLENFKLAVFNGQLRLAFENLVPVIDAIVDVLSGVDEDESTDTPTPKDKPTEIQVEEVKKTQKKTESVEVKESATEK